jgi:hypothetical protein
LDRHQPNTGEELDVYDLRPGDPEQIGEFRIVGRLGGGGMGTVYLGESTDSFQVAIKVVHEYLASDPEFRRRFGHEVEAASRISGTYTAEVLTADPDARLPWMATEFVPGRNLLQTVEADGPLSPEAVLDLAAGVADALTEIHRAGVIHRDLKPSNILLSPQGPRVIDFGIARAAEASTVTSTGKITGSAAYMSPEQAVGTKGVGPATDIFSLGALLYYAATGEPAFGTGPATAMLYRTVHAAVDMTPITSAPLRDLIDACLAKDPQDRPNAKHVAIAARTGQPVIRLPRTGTPPGGVPTGATALTTGGLSATYPGGASAYDALMDQVAIATASRGNPIIQPQALSTGKVRIPADRRRSPSMVQAAAGAALLVALIVGGVVMLTQKGSTPDTKTANVSDAKDGPSPSATGAAAATAKSKIKAAGVGSPSNVPTTGRRVTLDNGAVVVPSNGTMVTVTPSRTTGPKPTTTKSPTSGTTTPPGNTTTKPTSTGGGGGGGTTDPGDPTTDPTTTTDDPTTDPDDPTTDPGDPTTNPDDPTTTTDGGVIP